MKRTQVFKTQLVHEDIGTKCVKCGAATLQPATKGKKRVWCSYRCRMSDPRRYEEAVKDLGAIYMADRRISADVLSEREACAAMCEGMIERVMRGQAKNYVDPEERYAVSILKELAEAIRARGVKP